MQTDDKTLSNIHPLFSRLSGEVIWLLMEEHDASSEDINVFMDNVMAWRSAHLQNMRRLFENKELYLQITVDRVGDIPADQEACITCEKLSGKIIPASHPDLISLLPPYSLGCRCRGKIITKAELPESPDYLPLEDCPKHSFMCSTGWFLNYSWADKK
ncbi:hypothetical protein [Halodesulfovibrio aestuarii]|uniref:hypothetical protein n=1 Tax=Halodesulfovibrio aestuarii TaxID=126333 RepID=UPI003D353214